MLQEGQHQGLNVSEGTTIHSGLACTPAGGGAQPICQGGNIKDFNMRQGSLLPGAQAKKEASNGYRL